MFLSLVRPHRILSPITRRAATSLGVVALTVVMTRLRGNATVPEKFTPSLVRPEGSRDGIVEAKTSTREGERTDKHIFPPAGTCARSRRQSWKQPASCPP